MRLEAAADRRKNFLGSNKNKATENNESAAGLGCTPSFGFYFATCQETITSSQTPRNQNMFVWSCVLENIMQVEQVTTEGIRNTE